MKKLISFIAVIMTAAALIAGCGNGASTSGGSASKAASTLAPAVTLDPAKLENTVPITIELENGDVIKAELYPDVAPITVANFEKLVGEGFYDGLIFHRVIKGFMIQGGGFTPELEQKQTDSIKGEFKDNGVENELSHKRGVLSMARTSVNDSASSQFFIVQKDSVYLDGQYAAFGMVTEGMEVVDKIADAATDDSDKPIEDVVIKTITMD